jgi:hypothetical protein
VQHIVGSITLFEQLFIVKWVRQIESAAVILAGFVVVVELQLSSGFASDAVRVEYRIFSKELVNLQA